MVIAVQLMIHDMEDYGGITYAGNVTVIGNVISRLIFHVKLQLSPLCV